MRMPCHILCTGRVFPHCVTSYAVPDQKGMGMPCHIHCTGKVFPHDCVSSYALLDKKIVGMSCHIHCTGRIFLHHDSSSVVPDRHDEWMPCHDQQKNDNLVTQNRIYHNHQKGKVLSLLAHPYDLSGLKT